MNEMCSEIIETETIFTNIEMIETLIFIKVLSLAYIPLIPVVKASLKLLF